MHKYLPNAEQDLEEFIHNFVDGVVTTYTPGGAAAIRQGEPVENIKALNVILRGALLYRPNPGGLGIDDLSLESLLNKGQLRENTEQVGGRQCCVIDAVASAPGSNATPIEYASVWLDHRRALLPVKLIVYGAAQGEVASETVIEDAHEYVDNRGISVWLPIRIVTKTTISGTTYAKVEAVDKRLLRINSLKDAGELQIPFEPGATVIDTVAGQDYVIPGAQATQANLDTTATDTARGNMKLYVTLCAVFLLSIILGRKYLLKYIART